MNFRETNETEINRKTKRKTLNYQFNSTYQSWFDDSIEIGKCSESTDLNHNECTWTLLLFVAFNICFSQQIRNGNFA